MKKLNTNTIRIKNLIRNVALSTNWNLKNVVTTKNTKVK